MSVRPSLLAIAALIGMPGVALAKHPAMERPYTAHYDAKRGVYCIRFFSDALAADAHPGRSPILCQSRERWADEKVIIHHTGRSEQAAR